LELLEEDEGALAFGVEVGFNEAAGLDEGAAFLLSTFFLELPEID
jgi:hypothetical protein